MDYKQLPKICFSCDTILKDEYYSEYEKVYTESHDIIMKTLDDLGLKKACCRRMILSYNPVYYKMLSYYNESTINDAPRLK